MTARSQILNFKLTNGQIIFYVRHKQSTPVEIYVMMFFAFLFTNFLCVVKTVLLKLCTNFLCADTQCD